MPFKHRVNEGSVKCTDCHNPHGTFAATWSMGGRPRMVDQAALEMRSHASSATSISAVHSSMSMRRCASKAVRHVITFGTVQLTRDLLKRPVVFTVCLECHTGVGQFGRDANGIPTQTPSHNMSDPRYQNCTVCHARNLTRSNADPRFFR